MSIVKNNIAQAIKIFGIMAIVAALAAAAFPTRSFASAEDTNVGKLIVSVYESSSSSLSAVALQPVTGASISVINTSGDAVATASTDSSGRMTFELAKGVYKVQVSAKGYNSVTGTAVVNAGGDTSIKFELKANSRFVNSGR